jgi:hypothetical protein
MGGLLTEELFWANVPRCDFGTRSLRQKNRTTTRSASPLNAALRVVFVISSLLALFLSGSAQTGFDLKIGPPKAAIIGDGVGVGAGVTVLVLYLALRNPTITGACQQ